MDVDSPAMLYVPAAPVDVAPAYRYPDVVTWYAATSMPANGATGETRVTIPEIVPPAGRLKSMFVVVAGEVTGTSVPDVTSHVPDEGQVDPP